MNARRRPAVRPPRLAVPRRPPGQAPCSGSALTGPQAHWLPDRRRLHLHHGPIDLILQAWGSPRARAPPTPPPTPASSTILEELTAELPALRSPAPHAFAGPVARAMAAAIAPHRPAFITPMAAVAGAVADEILAHMTAAAPLARAYVNDGGDIALHLAPGETLTAAIAGAATRTTIAHADPVRGIATSGWRGRSFSLGIADAVTVLAAHRGRGRRRRHHDRQRRRPAPPPRHLPRPRQRPPARHRPRPPPRHHRRRPPRARRRRPRP